jgi:hypothetical protein
VSRSVREQSACLKERRRDQKKSSEELKQFSTNCVQLQLLARQAFEPGPGQNLGPTSEHNRFVDYLILLTYALTFISLLDSLLDSWIDIDIDIDMTLTLTALIIILYHAPPDQRLQTLGPFLLVLYHSKVVSEASSYRSCIASTDHDEPGLA